MHSRYHKSDKLETIMIYANAIGIYACITIDVK